MFSLFQNLAFRQFLRIFASMEAKINWKLVISFIIIIGGLIYITESYLMTIGIMLLLFVAYDFVLKKAKDEEEKEEKENQS